MSGRTLLRAGLRYPLGFLLAALLCIGTARAEEALPEVELTIHLDPASGRLEGEMVIAPPPTAAFTLLPGLEVVAARTTDETLAVEVTEPGHYRLEVPQAAPSLALRWQGHLDGQAEGFMVSSRGSLLPAQGGWYPRFDSLGPFALTLQIEVPPGQRAVGTGSLAGEPQADETGYRVRHVHPRTARVEVASGPWHERSRDVEGVRLRTLFPEPLDDAHAETYLDHAADYLVHFAERVGSYPYASFTMAASPAPVGLAFPGFTLLGERIIPLPFIPRTSLAHELMHAWWGAGVLVDYSAQNGTRGNWAEALTTYLADYALDEGRGEARETRRRWLLDLAALPDEFDRRLVDFRGQRDPALRLLGYQHGAMLLHMLRQRIGNDAFDEGLQRFAERHMHRQASWDELAEALGDGAGESLQSFVSAWTQRPGRPALAVKATRDAVSAGWRIEGSIEQSGAQAPWPLEVPLVIETAAGRERKVISLESRRAEFSLTFEHEPLALEVDPDFDLLRELDGSLPILRRVALDPASRLLALEPDLAELARSALALPLPSASGQAAPEHGPPLLVVGSTEQVAAWHEQHGFDEQAPFDVARQGQARAWAVSDAAVVAASGDDAHAIGALMRGLRHQLANSYWVLANDGATLASGTWPLKEPNLRVNWSP